MHTLILFAIFNFELSQTLPSKLIFKIDNILHTWIYFNIFEQIAAENKKSNEAEAKRLKEEMEEAKQNPYSKFYQPENENFIDLQIGKKHALNNMTNSN